MQALEDRTEKSRREMDLHDTIDTVRVLNARNQHIDIDKVERLCSAAPLEPQRAYSLLPPSPSFTFWCRLSQLGGRMTHWQTLSAAGDAAAAALRLQLRLWLRLRLSVTLLQCIF